MDRERRVSSGDGEGSGDSWRLGCSLDLIYLEFNRLTYKGQYTQ
jgi:hypothetical protein